MVSDIDWHSDVTVNDKSLMCRRASGNPEPRMATGLPQELRERVVAELVGQTGATDSEPEDDAEHD